jgi:hypothetical protein
VSACLNHARRDVTGVHYDWYNRHREALTAWSNELAGIVNGQLRVSADKPVEFERSCS